MDNILGELHKQTNGTQQNFGFFQGQFYHCWQRIVTWKINWWRQQDSYSQPKPQTLHQLQSTISFPFFSSQVMKLCTKWNQASIPLFSVPVLYFVFRLGLFNLDDALGMTSGLDLSGYNAPSAGYGAPTQSYGAPAPAPSYNAPAPSYNAPAPSYSGSSSSFSNGAGLTTVNNGGYFSSKEDDQVIVKH